MSEAVRKALKLTRAPAAARTVLAIYAAHAGKKDFLAWPSQAEIARMAGIGERQVRNLIRALEDLGELALIQRGMKGRGTAVYRVAILADEVIDDDDNRQSVAGSDASTTGTTLPVVKSRLPEIQRHDYRQSSSARRGKEEAPSLPASLTGGEVSDSAGEEEDRKSSVAPGIQPDLTSGDVAGKLGDRAREHSDDVVEGEEYQRWLEEVRARYPEAAE